MKCSTEALQKFAIIQHNYVRRHFISGFMRKNDIKSLIIKSVWFKKVFTINQNKMCGHDLSCFVFVGIVLPIHTNLS